MEANKTFNTVDTMLYSVIIPIISLVIMILSFSWLTLYTFLITVMLAVEKHNSRKNKTYA